MRCYRSSPSSPRPDPWTRRWSLLRRSRSARVAYVDSLTQNADLLSTSRLLMLMVLMARTVPDAQHTDMKKLCEIIHNYSKKHGQLKQAVARMVQLAMLFLDAPQTSELAFPASPYEPVALESETMEVDTDSKKPAADDDDERQGKEDPRILALFEQARRVGDTSLSEDDKRTLMESLREVTEGKVFLEVERARVTRRLAHVLFDNGDKHKAADVLQELAVETFGSLDRREKVEIILEQMRLNLERDDLARVNAISRKINPKFFEDEAQHDLKLSYYDIMVQVGTREERFLDVCKYYREVLATPRVREDEAQRQDTLKHVIVFLVLAPHDNEQSDLLARVDAQESLDAVPEYKSLLKCFLTPELMRWPGIEALYGPTLRSLDVLAPSERGADERWQKLHTRVIEYNIQVVAKYYTKIRLARLAQLLDLTTEQAEAALADLVTKKTIHARMDRPAGVVNFRPRLSDAELLNQWSNDMEQLLHTVEKVSHLVEKEWAIQRAGLVVKANEA